MEQTHEDYWYDHRRELLQGMIFRARDGLLVQLDRTVPGDETKWHVLNWFNGYWWDEDATIEPGELTGKPLDPAAIAKAEQS